MLPREAGAATKFLQSKIHGEIKVDGSHIEIEDRLELPRKFKKRKTLSRQ